MKTKFFLFAGLIAAMTLSSCSENLEYDASASSKQLIIKVADANLVDSASTRAAYSGFTTTFESGDKIGLYVVEGTQVILANVPYTFDGAEWTTSSKVEYKDGYSYYAYYPYVASPYTPDFTQSTVDAKFSTFLTDTSDKFHKTDQSTKANFQASDLMIAEGSKPGDKTASFAMLHKKGLAVISQENSNKWYYTDGDGTKYDVTLTFTENIPYNRDGTQYFLVKPETETAVAGQNISVSAGKYRTITLGEITGTPSYTYSISSYPGSSWSWSNYSPSKPTWLTITTNTVSQQPTEFLVTTTNSTSTTTSKGSFNLRSNVPADATLKAAPPVSDVDLSMVNNDGSARASRTTANCYLVHAAGTYKLPLVYGNAIKNGATNESAYYTTQTSNTLQRLVNHNDTGITDPWIKTVVGSSPDGAELVWEDVQGMISSVGIDGDYLTFTVDNSSIGEGNAVVAAKLGGTIVWSWHIWVTPQTLTETTEIATGSHTYQVAPVNVGQVDGLIKANATVYAGDLCKVQAKANGITIEFQVAAKDYIRGGSDYYNPSPYYQWGRKDAMYPCTGAFNSEGTLVSTYSGTSLVTVTSATPGETIQHPNYWYYASSNYGPYGTNSTYAGKYNYWDMNQTSTGNITTATVKTVYDPCPPGFCVPTGNLYYYANSKSGQAAWQSTPPGRNWTVNGTPIFFPASGIREYRNGSLRYVGSYGYYWSASAWGSGSGRYLYFGSGDWYWESSFRAFGFSVRPVAEE